MAEDDEIKKLEILLEHWIEHNVSHSRDFEEWARKAEEIGENSASRSIMEAVEHLKRGNEALQDALDKVREKGKR